MRISIKLRSSQSKNVCERECLQIPWKQDFICSKSLLVIESDLHNVVYGEKIIYAIQDLLSRKPYYSVELQLNDSRKLRAASELSSSLTCSHIDYRIFILMSMEDEKLNI